MKVLSLQRQSIGFSILFKKKKTNNILESRLAILAFTCTISKPLYTNVLRSGYSADGAGHKTGGRSTATNFRTKPAIASITSRPFCM